MAILETLQASDIGINKGLRLKKGSNGLSLHIDVPNNNDTVIWQNENIILIVDRETERRIGDALVDVDDGPEEARLVLRHKVTT
jgi:hypothetical protein